MSERTLFLQKSNAVPTSPELYALWLSLAVNQAGRTARVQVYPSNYTDKARVINGKPAVTPYEDLGQSRWTPTSYGPQIPAGYGSQALELMVLVNGDQATTRLAHTTGDRRKGWEWGHTEVFIIEANNDAAYGLLASTNKEGRLESYADVEAIRKQYSIPELIDMLMNSHGQLASTAGELVR